MQISKSELQKLLADVFEGDPSAIALTTTPDDVGAWDSFNHLNMVVTLEERCGVSFSTDEVASMNPIGIIVDVLRKHGVDVDWPE